MRDYAKAVKEKLKSIIQKTGKEKEKYVKNPKKDFIRKRKLPFEKVIKIIMSMGGNSLNKEMLEYSGYDGETASTSAFIHQREKISPKAFEYIFKEFADSFSNLKTYEGYRLFAVDGSDIRIACNPAYAETYYQTAPDIKGYNLLHLNAIYDLCNKLYIDAYIQPSRKENEHRALAYMADHSQITENVILVADRGYESYNVIAHICEKGWKYIIRVKDTNSYGIFSGLKLPKDFEFDEKIQLILTKKQTNVVKSNPGVYKFLHKAVIFDYLDKNSEFYPILFRAVRVEISDGIYETLMTNLDSATFPADKLKIIYHMRWGIETSFRELKYSIGLSNFHAKKSEYILQEIFARLVMYNFCELITLHTVVKLKSTKHEYQANFTVAISICRYFFRCRGNIRQPNVEALIQKYILPIRFHRNAQRSIKSKSFVYFNYRI